MIPPKYSDVLKPVNDLIGKDFPTGFEKLEIKTKTSNGVKFTVSGTRNQSNGIINGEISGKYFDAPRNVTYTETFNTGSMYSLQIESENNFAKGLKVEVKGSASINSTKHGLESSAQYKCDDVFATLNSVMVGKAPHVSSSLVMHRGGFLVGTEMRMNPAARQLETVDALVGYTAPDFRAAVQTRGTFSFLTAAFHQNVTPGVLEVAARSTYDLKNSDKNVTAEVAAKYNLDNTTFVKARINNNGHMGLSYSQSLRPGVTAVVGALVDVNGLGENNHKLGAHITFES
ncbi:Voltage-dependent anion-selective channel protein 2 [Zancudomyces culisetae]|uniref:Voltage-dependent anion-selective channel protein 2 n=1 Tax=Zancudomyces culisetae TaxID=1213189 RepID=A0A1R1PLC8_ZANCU|nr:Voltage-dependent anion-selective channel protein 2 [Zancudomyces culisetae]|eukprot:OMH81778.1 Voltage-dependent anion-selective channel protein 2 [Zancudomyces culisetae]